MPGLEELQSLEHQLESLRTRIEEEAAHVAGLSDQPDLARQAQETLSASTEELRLMQVELEELKARVDKEVDASRGEAPD
jgi:cell division protein FtsB